MDEDATRIRRGGQTGAGEIHPVWERRILDLAQTGQGSVAAIVFGLNNRAPEEWRDKAHTELTGTVERIHRVERVIVCAGLSDPVIGRGEMAAIE